MPPASDSSGNQFARTSSGPAKHRQLGGLLVLYGITIAVLLALVKLLQVPSGLDVEDLLGWTDGQAVQVLQDLWDKRLGYMKPWIFAGYFTLDSGVFVPVYGLGMLAIWGLTGLAFLDHVGSSSPLVQRLHMGLGLTMVAALVLVDLAENSLALFLHGPATVAVPLSLGVLALTVWALLHWLERAWLNRVWSRFQPLWPAPLLLAVLLTVAALGGLWLLRKPGASSSTGLVLLAVAHGAKHCLLGVWVGVVAAQGTWLLFGPHHDKEQWPRFVDLRLALAALPWRSLYVLLALAVCVALMLVMNQGRDVIYALAARPWADEAGVGAWVQTLFVLSMNGVALLLLGYACWLWARAGVKVAPRVPPTEPGVSIQRQRPEDLLARDWARLLGIAPGVLVLALCLSCLPDAISTSVATNRFGPVLVLLPFAALVLVGAALFIWQRDRLGARHTAYYACQPLAELIAEMRQGRVGKGSPYRVAFGLIGPRTLPVLALVLAMLCRGLQLFVPQDWQLPSLSLAIVLLEVSFWLSLAGWVSLYEHSDSIPWALFLILWAGAIGALGLTENHEAPLALGGFVVRPAAYFVVSVALAVALMLGYWYLTAIALEPVPNKTDDTRQKRMWATLAGLLLVCFGLPGLASRFVGTPEVGRPTLSAEAAGPAMTAWLEAACRGPLQEDLCQQGRELPVYVLAAEGGGIRNAHWTALALARLHLADPGFELRTFAMSGVSGGAVGLAVYRACRIETAAKPDAARELVACIERFGSKDLLGPLVGAWFFEDVIARWLPLPACNQPACGFLSRGLWFEQAMLAAAPGLALGLIEGRQKLKEATAAQGVLQPHVPYLLLNSTWVETGERVVASELLVDWHIFPSARDQLALLGRSDLPLVSAAHNSARFPFTNALGSVHTSRERCARDAYLLREAGASDRPATGAGAEIKACGHMADGGYFDVAGAQGAADVLHLLDRCLRDLRTSDSDACPRISPERRTQLAQVLRPRLLLVRNGVQPEAPAQGDSPCVKDDMVVHRQDVDLPTHKADPAKLGRPVCAGNHALFVDALGPLITAVNAIGTGSNGRLAVARARDAIHYPDHRADPGDGGAALPQGLGRLQTVDLVENGPMFPLGWHLSPTARKEMRHRACSLLKPDELLGVATTPGGALCPQP